MAPAGEEGQSLTGCRMGYRRVVEYVKIWGAQGGGGGGGDGGA